MKKHGASVVIAIFTAVLALMAGLIEALQQAEARARKAGLLQDEAA